MRSDGETRNMQSPLRKRNTDADEEAPVIHGDRRSDRRYPLELELRYKLIRRKKVLETGYGRTLDMSSGGILFETARPLPPGLTIELSVSWPVLLRNTAPLKLVVIGRVVRNEANCTAVRMLQHEFRTQGARDLIARAAFAADSVSGGVQPAVFASSAPLAESRKVH